MKFTELYDELKSIYGELGKWWPGTREEIIISAVLTQNTNWQNVEKALVNIRKYCQGDILQCLGKLSEQELSELIRPAGFFNIKARRLKNLLSWIEMYDYELDRISALNTDKLRTELLSINGIGKETADSIILYAFEKPIFVVDAYTKRILKRTFDIEYKEYDEYRKLFEETFTKDVKLYQEFHGLIVEHAKAHCRTKPLCEQCPIEDCFYKIKGKSGE
ncbi:MAG: endonuclease III domain-containing protein [Fervidobacterium sp.]|uniref:endonuclease III domain-containing protein n=1 Tax=Fervidobacterium sp. TaxID=1871331 RepID=UPI00404B7852